MTTFKESINEVIRIPIGLKTPGLMWYLYMMIGIYLIVPFLDYKHFSQDSYRNSKMYILLWLISVFFSIMRELLGDETFLRSDVHGRSYDVLQYFIGYLGYFILGSYLSGVNQTKRLLLLVLLIAIFFINWRIDAFIGLDRSGYLTFNAILMGTIIFVVFKNYVNVKCKGYNIIKKLSKFSYGIYLSHMVVYILIVERLFTFVDNTMVKAIMGPLFTFFLAAILTAFLYNIPYVKKIVGGK